jgi:hypothetical protein
MCLNGLQSVEMQQVLEAAARVPEGSPAYLTANYFVIDALIAQKKLAPARERIGKILARKDLPPSARNLFLAQQMAVSKNVHEFVHSAIMHPPVVSKNNFFLPNDWPKIEVQRSFYSDPATFDAPVAKDLNRNLPLSGWMRLAGDATVPSYLRGRIVRSTWLRAHLLNRPGLARAISLDFARAFPRLSEQIKQCDLASSTDERRFVLACLVLKNFGMTPYVEGGVERHGEMIDQFDYYNANYWVPVPLAEKKASKPGDDDYEYTYPSVVQPGTNRILQMMQTYYSPGIKNLLSADDRKASDSETQTLLINSPARFLGDSVFAWAKAHPQDPRVPEMLYHVVKIPKWSATSDVASQYSHDAYMMLHSRYKTSKWAAKATCWY